MINPPHTKIYISGLGAIREEWSWCWDHLKYLKICVIDRKDFALAAEPLIKYIKSKK